MMVTTIMVAMVHLLLLISTIMVIKYYDGCIFFQLNIINSHENTEAPVRRVCGESGAAEDHARGQGVQGTGGSMALGRAWDDQWLVNGW